MKKKSNLSYLGTHETPGATPPAPVVHPQAPAVAGVPSIPVSALPAIFDLQAAAERRAQAAQHLEQVRAAGTTVVLPPEGEEIQTPVRQRRAAPRRQAAPVVLETNDEHDEEMRAAEMLAGTLSRIEDRLDAREQADNQRMLDKHKRRRLEELRRQGVGVIEGLITGSSIEEIDAAVSLAQTEYALAAQTSIENHYRANGWDPSALRAPQLPQQQAMLYTPPANAQFAPPQQHGVPQGFVGQAPPPPPAYSFPTAVSAPPPLPQEQQGLSVAGIPEAFASVGGRYAAVRTGAYRDNRNAIMQSLRQQGGPARGQQWSLAQNQTPFLGNQPMVPNAGPPPQYPQQPMQQPQFAPNMPQGVYQPQYAPQAPAYATAAQAAAFPGAAPQFTGRPEFQRPAPVGQQHIHHPQQQQPQQFFPQSAPQPQQLEAGGGMVYGFDPSASVAAAQAATSRRANQRVGNFHGS